jgi:energy-converting hydrogenase A subunit R
MGRVFVTDCEGPISKNDNAFELAELFIPNGARFFKILSRYDDVLAYLEKRPNYSAGYTLKLIAPFLKTYGATNQAVEDYSSKHLVLIDDAYDALHHVSSLLPSYIVSTSYEQYIEALCRVLDFRASNTFSTHLDLDKFRLDEKESARLVQIKDQVDQLPEIEVPDWAKTISDLPTNARSTVKKLDAFFFSELPKMSSGGLLTDIQPIGSRQKEEALEKIRRRHEPPRTHLMYVGDSITDTNALRNVRRARGLAVSYNGNQYAVREADIAVLSSSALPIAALGEAFAKSGRAGALRLAETWPDMASDQVSRELAERLLGMTEHPRVRRITRNNLRELTEASNEFRKTVRGHAVGALG